MSYDSTTSINYRQVNIYKVAITVIVVPLEVIEWYPVIAYKDLY